MSRKHDIDKLTAIDKMLGVMKTEAKSAYEKGVIEYAESMLEDLTTEVEAGNENANCSNIFTFEKSLLGGETDTKAYSYNGYGAALCSNYAIAEKLSEPAKFQELKGKDDFGSCWADLQFIAINDAWHILRCLYIALERMEKDYSY